MLAGLRVCYISPEFGLCEKFYDDILETLPPQIIYRQNKSRLQIDLITGGVIKFFSGEALHRVRGWEFDELIVDEAGYIPDLEKEWNSSLRPLLMKTRGKAIFVSTPRGKNYFYSLFTKGQNEEHDFKSWQFSSYENPNLPKEELEDLIREMPEVVYRQEILAIPGENSTNPFGTDNIDRNVINQLSSKPSVVYGIDVAQSFDWTVIVGLDEDGTMSYFDRFKKPWYETINVIKNLDPYVTKIIDSTSVGGVVLSDLEHNSANVIGFNFSKTSKPALMSGFVKDVESGNVKYNKITADEMHTFEFKYTSSGGVKYEAQSGFHDDCVCATALANHHRKTTLNLKQWKLYR